MVLLHPCIPCQHGDHDHCSGGRAAPEGMLGGWECSCRECERQANTPPASREQQPTPAQVERVRETHQAKRAVRGPEPDAQQTGEPR